MYFKIYKLIYEHFLCAEFSINDYIFYSYNITFNTLALKVTNIINVLNINEINISQISRIST